MEKLGRRLTMVISLTVGGVALLANAAVDLTGNSGDGFFVYFNTVMLVVLNQHRIIAYLRIISVEIVTSLKIKNVLKFEIQEINRR